MNRLAQQLGVAVLTVGLAGMASAVERPEAAGASPALGTIPLKQALAAVRAEQQQALHAGVMRSLAQVLAGAEVQRDADATIGEAGGVVTPFTEPSRRSSAILP